MNYKYTHGRKVLPWRKNLSPVYNLLPLNSHLRTTYLSLFAFNSSPSLHSHTLPPFQMELEKDGLVDIGLLWCQDVQNIGL